MMHLLLFWGGAEPNQKRIWKRKRVEAALPLTFRLLIEGRAKNRNSRKCSSAITFKFASL
jgi:hypothetical protein